MTRSGIPLDGQPRDPHDRTPGRRLGEIADGACESNWDFRTVDGIARETSLPREHVERLLRTHGAAVRQAVSRSERARGWRVVYTLKSRPRKKIREFFSDLLTFASQ